MRIISKSTLREFWTRHPGARAPLQTWYRDVYREQWGGPADVTATFHNVSILAGNRQVFSIKGNSYRLVVAVNYPFRLVYICFIGTHAEYDRIDATEV